jgi:IPT/TIG domain-containing protein
MKNTHIIILSFVAIVVISLGCGTPPSAPSSLAAPVAAPAAAAATAVPPTTGAFTVSPMAGPIGEEIRILGAGFVPGATVTLDGMAARVVAVHPAGTTIYVTTPAHAAGTVDVVVTNAGTSVTLAGGYTFVPVDVFSVTASPSVVTPGGAMTVKWVAPIGRSCLGGGDYVALYRLEDGDLTTSSNGHSDLWYDHLCGATSGTKALTAPTQPGQYDFRYMVGGRDTAVARTNPITVSQ